MKMCNQEFEVRLKTSLVSLQNLLGLSCIRWYRDERLDYLVLLIIEYLNRVLLLEGACTILQRLQEFSDLYEEGTRLIIDGKILDLTQIMRIDTGNPDYNEDLFILAWGIFMSSLYMQLYYNYSGVFDEKINTDCHSGCHKADCGNLGNGTNSSLGNIGSWENGNINGGCGCNN
jgi:hypothetical protein